MQKHFVEFSSPGTFVAETTTEEIDSWDTDMAIEKARKVKQRHGATPYGFKFLTRTRTESALDSKVTDRSCMYYLGGKTKTLDEVKNENDPKNKILISNMEMNGYDKIIVNDNSWRWTQPLEKDDVVLDFKMEN